MNSFLRTAGIAIFAFVLRGEKPLRVVCFGDSTTAPRTGVRTYCETIRSADLVTVNRGVGGDTTEMARVRFAADVLASKPEVTIIQFGINDSTVDVWKSPPEHGPRVPVERFTDGFDQADGFNGGREPYLRAIRDVAKRTGAALVDIDKAYRERGRIGDLLLDGMHPNSEGHRLTAALLLRELHHVD